MWETKHAAGAAGSEGGTVITDEEYKSSCRITLEKCGEYYAITCGVYGAMCHTAFCGHDDFTEKYEAMKKDLQEFIDKDTTSEEELEFYESFCNKY